MVLLYVENAKKASCTINLASTKHKLSPSNGSEFSGCRPFLDSPRRASAIRMFNTDGRMVAREAESSQGSGSKTHKIIHKETWTEGVHCQRFFTDGRRQEFRLVAG
jgi:hypothetical protein